MIYQLKRFLKVSSEENCENDVLKIKLGHFAEDGFDLEGSKSILFLLSLLNGKNTLTEVKKELDSKFSGISDEDFFGVITSFIDNGIIEDVEVKAEDLTKDERERYDRHLLYYSIFSNNKFEIQSKLKKSKVALIGMGGIGCWTSYALAGSGNGTLIGVDNDIIESSNLTRQILYTEADLGMYKVDVAAKRIKEYNSMIDFIPVKQRIDSVESVEAVIKDVDFVVLSADGPSEIHKWVDVACTNLKIPYSNVGYINYMGVCGPMIIPGKTNGNYSKRINEELAQENEFSDYIKTINSRYQPPSYGAINGVVSCLQAIEVIKYLTDFAPPQTRDKRYMFNSFLFESSFQEF